jgi:membrane protein
MFVTARAGKAKLADQAERLLHSLLHFGHTLRRAALSANEHDALNLAQATAYSAMFALFPALIVAAALVSVLPDTVPFRMQMATFFGHVLPSNVSPLLEAYFNSVDRSHHAQSVLLGSAVVTLTGASGVMATLMEGFRRAHKLPLLRGNFWPVRARALVLVPLSLVPMTAASALVVFGHLLTLHLAGDLSPALRAPVYVVAFLLRWTVALAGSTGIIAVIYHLGTDLTTHMRDHLEPLMQPWQLLRRDWSWSASLPGAAVATMLWFVSTLLFWLFLIALSVLVGAEFNAQRTVQHRDPQLAELLWKLPGLRRRRTGRIAD